MSRKATPIIVLLLAFAIAVSLLGCTSTAPVPTTAPDTSSATEAPATATASVTEPATLEPVTFTFFNNNSWVPSDAWTGIIPEEITKRTGVTLKVTKAVDSSQLGVMIASNDLPDLTFAYEERNRLSSANLCYAWDDLIAKYCPDWQIPEVYKSIARSYSSDGKFYTLIDYFSTDEEWANAAVGCPGQGALYYRDDILQALGNPPMNTLDDYLNVLAMVKQKYPDMIPLGLDAPYWFFQPFAVWLGTQASDYIILEDGRVVYKIADPKYMDYMKFCNNLYRNGYITAENYAIQSETDSLAQIAYSGKAFSFCWYTGDKPITLDANTQKNVPTAHWKGVGTLNADAKTVRAPTGWCGTYISLNCKQPDRAIKFMEFMWSPEGRHLSFWGREGTDYTLDSKGVPVFSADWLASRTDQAAHAKKYNPWYYLGGSEVDEMYSYFSGLPQEVIDFNNVIKDHTLNRPALGIAAPSSTSDMGAIQIKLADLVKTEEAKVIFSNTEEEFLANFNNFMAAAKKIGIEDLNAWVTNNYKEINTKYNFN